MSKAAVKLYSSYLPQLIFYRGTDEKIDLTNSENDVRKINLVTRTVYILE